MKRPTLKPHIVKKSAPKKKRKDPQHRPARQAAPGPSGAPVLEGSENDFGATDLGGWDERVFLNAEHFRIFRYKIVNGQNKRDDCEVMVWPQALALAIKQQREGYQVVIYAVTATGRTAICQPSRWLELSNLYDVSQKDATK